MNDNEQNFEELKHLLKLKRHEIPPPGYFHNFSGNVIAGIRAERELGSRTPQLSEMSWLARFFRIFETRPGLVGGFATSLVLVLVGGVVLTDHSDSDSSNIMLPGSFGGSAPSAATQPNYARVDNSASSSGITISTNPATSLQPMSSLFGQANPLFQSANFAPAQ